MKLGVDDQKWLDKATPWLVLWVFFVIPISGVAMVIASVAWYIQTDVQVLFTVLLIVVPSAWITIVAYREGDFEKRAPTDHQRRFRAKLDALPRHQSMVLVGAGLAMIIYLFAGFGLIIVSNSTYMYGYLTEWLYLGVGLLTLVGLPVVIYQSVIFSRIEGEIIDEEGRKR